MVGASPLRGHAAVAPIAVAQAAHHPRPAFRRPDAQHPRRVVGWREGRPHPVTRSPPRGTDRPALRRSVLKIPQTRKRDAGRPSLCPICNRHRPPCRPPARHRAQIPEGRKNVWRGNFPRVRVGPVKGTPIRKWRETTTPPLPMRKSWQIQCARPSGVAVKQHACPRPPSSSEAAEPSEPTRSRRLRFGGKKYYAFQ